MDRLKPQLNPRLGFGVRVKGEAYRGFYELPSPPCPG